jgi:hypothetical protein
MPTALLCPSMAATFGAYKHPARGDARFAYGRFDRERAINSGVNRVRGPVVRRSMDITGALDQLP